MLPPVPSKQVSKHSPPACSQDRSRERDPPPSKSRKVENMSDRVHTTPIAIHDAIETQIPFRYRAEVNVLFADLKSNAPVVRENAILRGHAVASQLKSIAESQTTPGLYTDAEPSACLRVANYIYAAMDDARQRAPSPYPSGAVNDAAQATDSKSAQIGDAATEYQRMLQRDADAWKNVK
jgi:hypothetical protein